MMFFICLLASNVRTEPQSEIGRNRGEKKARFSKSLVCFLTGDLANVSGAKAVQIILVASPHGDNGVVCQHPLQRAGRLSSNVVSAVHSQY